MICPHCLKIIPKLIMQAGIWRNANGELLEIERNLKQELEDPYPWKDRRDRDNEDYYSNTGKGYGKIDLVALVVPKEKYESL